MRASENLKTTWFWSLVISKRLSDRNTATECGTCILYPQCSWECDHIQYFDRTFAEHNSGLIIQYRCYRTFELTSHPHIFIYSWMRYRKPSSRIFEKIFTISNNVGIELMVIDPNRANTSDQRILESIICILYERSFFTYKHYSIYYKQIANNVSPTFKNN